MALLLIPEAINKILERGRREGQEAERERIRQFFQDYGAPLTPEQVKILFEESKTHRPRQAADGGKDTAS